MMDYNRYHWFGILSSSVKKENSPQPKGVSGWGDQEIGMGLSFTKDLWPSGRLAYGRWVSRPQVWREMF
jgi:hypothetical protein